MKYFFPLHFDSGNRGCQAIAQSSAILLNKKKEDIMSYTRDVVLDKQLGLDEYMSLVPTTKDSILIDKLLGLLNKLFNSVKIRSWRNIYPYLPFLRMMEKDDVLISTGGDMMCYDDCQAVYTNNYMHSKKLKTILWGCSMGPENLNKEKEATLPLFSLIYARESLTYDFFNSMGLKNVCLFPDPAFILKEKECPLPACFSRNDGRNPVIGINVSYFVLKNELFKKELFGLIDYILKDTQYDILLIPHVTWKQKNDNQDDREVSQLLADEFNNNARIDILNMDNLDYCQIRYVISKCSLFMGARTHAVISAYSMCVPTIALGYSIKAKGIAKDLGLDECLVVNSKNYSAGGLLGSFKYLQEHKSDIHKHLDDIMPDYKNRVYGIRAYL